MKEKRSYNLLHNMKTIVKRIVIYLLLLLSVFCSHSVLASNIGYGLHIQKMLEAGHCWNYERIKADGNSEKVSLRIIGDTVVTLQGYSRHRYKLAYETPEDTIVRYLLGETAYRTFSYDMEEGMKENCIFAFDMDMGSHSTYWGNGIVQAQGDIRMADLVNVNGQLRDRYYLYVDDETEPCDIWISGIGSLKTGLAVVDGLKSLAMGDSLRFLSFTDGQYTFFTADFDMERVGTYTYRPTIEDHKVWYCGSFPGDVDIPAWTYQYFTSGDTVINGRQCCKLYANNHRRSGKVEYFGGIYEEDRKVWFIEDGRKDAHLLYDFNMPFGNILTIMFDNEIKTIWNSGDLLKYGDAYVSYDNEYYHLHVTSEGEMVEGLGSLRGLLFPILGNRTGAIYRLMLCTVNEEVKFDAHILPKEDILDVDLPKQYKPTCNAAIYDLSGRIIDNRKSVNRKLPKGIYIQNGRKFVVK